MNKFKLKIINIINYVRLGSFFLSWFMNELQFNIL